MANRVALVSCVHHKPWLVMSTLVTTLIQDFQDVDLHLIHNVGGGDPAKASYAEYFSIAAESGSNAQLSAYDTRVRDVCALNRPGVFEREYENDHALDSGAWYKFIRSGTWRAYDYVIFAGEGTLLTRRNTLSALLSFARRRGVHFIASGHEKRRIPKDQFLEYSRRYLAPGECPTPLDRLHGRMIRASMDLFRRDPAFDRLYEGWRSDFSTETENHVPDVRPRSALAWRARHAVSRRWGTAHDARARGLDWPARLAQQAPIAWDYAASRASLWMNGAGSAREPEDPVIIVGGRPARLADVTETESEDGVRFHREEGPEWFGCTTIHLMSRTFLERLAAKLDQFELYAALDLPFAGTPLEVIWGFMPAWLGFEKWFTDGFHRVRKNFVTHRREDYPPEMASYINRYHRGRVSVGWHGDFLRIKALCPGLAGLRTMLPEVYFGTPVSARS